MNSGESDNGIADRLAAYGFFRLRARIRRDPRLLAEDPVLRSAHALTFAAPGAVAAAGVALAATSLFNFFFIDQPPLWNTASGDGVAMVFSLIFATLTTAALPLSAILSAGFVARAAPSAEALRVLGLDEVRRRFLFSEAAVSLWPTILLASMLGVITSVNALSAQMDVTVANLIGDVLERSTLWTFIGALALYGFTSFIQTLMIFARSVDVSGRYETQWGAFARGLLILVIMRPVIGALLYAFLALFSLALTVGVYAGGLKMREAVGLEDPEAVSEWFEELSATAREAYRDLGTWIRETIDLEPRAGGGRVDGSPEMDARSEEPALNDCMRIIFFQTGSSALDDEAKAAIDFVASCSYAAEGDVVFSPKPVRRGPSEETQAGTAALPEPRIIVIGHVDSAEAAASSDSGVGLSRARAEAIKAWLMARDVPPEDIETKSAGAAEPLVPTAPATSEALNRRAFVAPDR